jgi:hypothetical protein
MDRPPLVTTICKVMPQARVEPPRLMRMEPSLQTVHQGAHIRGANGPNRQEKKECAYESQRLQGSSYVSPCCGEG